MTQQNIYNKILQHCEVIDNKEKLIKDIKTLMSKDYIPLNKHKRILEKKNKQLASFKKRLGLMV